MARPLPKMAHPAKRRRAKLPRSRRLFDLGFLELDVLARDGGVFAEGHLLGDVPRILLRHIIEAGVGGADELDLDGGRLGHDSLSNSWGCENKKRRPRRSYAPQPLPRTAAPVKVPRL